MTDNERRLIETIAIATPLAKIEDPDMLAFLATLIDTQDYLRSKLMTERNRQKRREKLERMRPYLPFRALSCDAYELAEIANSCGVQPIYQEQEDVSGIVTPASHLHEIL